MPHRTYLPSRRLALGLLGAAAVLPRAALGGDLDAVSGRAFGTTWRLAARHGSDLAPLGRSIEKLFAEIDRTFSPWREDSTIARFNALPAGRPLRHPDLAEVTSAALAIARRSAGAFDPTVGPLVARWGFGPIREGGAPDWRGLSAGAGTLSKLRDDLTLDLCGIAKGWALDRAAARVAASGVDDFLFELGGEFIARGRHPGGRNWRLTIETPDAVAGPAPALRLPAGTAVATSGLWTQSFRLADRLYSHIIDTDTAAPVAGALRSVTVLAGDAMTADGWATALCAAGAEAGPALAASMDLAALFLIEEAGALRRVETGPIRDLLL
ncbi:MAG: FAD:protein FMN transferase [Paracoccaceae bacterium]|nr:FAD:protein FMN transferase [Paracoccaceae bacterium]